MITFISNTTAIETSFNLGTMQDVIEYCKDKEVLGVDTETEGLDFTSDKMIMLQIGDQEHQFVIDTRFISIEPLREILESTKIIKIFHNAKFDYKFIKRWANIECENVYDTYLAEKILTCGKKVKYGLSSLCEHYLNITMDKDVRSDFIGQSSAPFSTKQIVYGAKDIEYLLQIRELQLPKISKNKLDNVMELENQAVLAFADIEYNGLNIDQESWKILAVQSKQDAVSMMDTLDQMTHTNPKLKDFIAKEVQTDLFMAFEDIRKVDIKWTSPKQVLAVFKKLIPKLENVDAKALYKYRKKFPIIDKYVTYKEKMKLSTSYGEAFFKYIASDDRIHTSFNQILDTGRVASSSPKLLGE